MSKQQRNNIEITVRVRPIHNGKNHEVPRTVRSFSYPTNVVVGSNQTVAFDTIGKPLLSKMSNGYNTTLLAYGQTGSGKTYTVFGPTGSLTEGSLHGETTHTGAPVQWGIFPRIALEMIRKTGNLKASAIEIYSNSPFDLLNDRKPLKLSRSKNAAIKSGVRVNCAPEGGSKFNNYSTGLNGEHPKGCYCRHCFAAAEEAKEERKRRIAKARGEKLPPTKKKTSSASSKNSSSTTTTSTTTTTTTTGNNARTVGEVLWNLKTPEDVARFSRQIESSRVAHGHALNDRSSRSHCLVRLRSTMTDSRGNISKQCFTFVDLAGSERTGKSGVEGQRMNEAITINKALTVLGRCIRAVGKGHSHVPWRDAVLCQLLRSSFEGRTHTSVVVNVSPEYEDETLCTLRFGETVSCVTNKATKVVGKNAKKEIESLQSEILHLRSRKKRMEQDGLGAGFVDGCIHSEMLSLKANMEKLVIIQSRLSSLKVQLAETSSPEKKRRLAEKVDAVTKEEYNHRALVLREQSIKALWHYATPQYESLIAELNERENQLRMLTGK
jgi:hypothetical protein